MSKVIMAQTILIPDDLIAGKIFKYRKECLHVV